jgi:hypothetical protein
VLLLKKFSLYNISLSVKVPGREAPTSYTQTGPCRERCPFSEPLFTCLRESPIKTSLDKTMSHLCLKIFGKRAPAAPSTYVAAMYRNALF